MIYLSKDNLVRSAKKNLFTQPPFKESWGCVKSIFPAPCAKLYLDGDIFPLILLRKIKGKMSPSKESFAAEGGERLFTQPLKKYLLPPKAAEDIIYNPAHQN